MAQKKRGERGVVRMATSFALVWLGGLLTLAGCSSEVPTEEGVASVSQGVVVCGVNTCEDRGPCVAVSCSALKTCVYTNAKELATCSVGKIAGSCVTGPRDTYPVCCTGCYVPGKVLGTYACVANPTVTNCGDSGAQCVNCDGGDKCTQYSCVNGTCGDKVPVLDKEPCTDGSGSCWKGSCCTGCIDKNETCQVGSAVTACGKSSANGLVGCKDCTDAEPTCTKDVCNADGTCSNPAVTNGTACLDTNKCDGAESCQTGVCTDQAGFTCPTDNNPCHAPSCDATNGCGQKPLSGVSCADANLCNGAEMCNAGVCEPGTPKSCDDKNPCTIDSCDPKTGGCSNVPGEAGVNCDDGNLCNGIGICDAGGKCVSNPSPSCDDGNICTTDSCDPTPVTGGCKHSNNALDCSDNDPCTNGDKCGGGACVPGAAVKCDDGNACTADSCKAGKGCQFDPLTDTACNDGNDCSTGDICKAGVCTSTGGKTCPDDGNPCTTAKCDPNAGSTCSQVNDNSAKCRVDLCHEYSQCSGGQCPAGTPIDCDDGNPCTSDGCDPRTGCTHSADPKGKCSDGDVCTDDICKDGRCVAVDAACEPIDDCHKAGTCNPKTGICDAPRADSGTSCDAGTGTCNDMGKCIANPVPGGGGAPNEGGAGGQPVTEPVPQGGEPSVTPNGGAGNEPSVAAGDNSGGTTTNTAGTSGSTSTPEGGAPEEAVKQFVRTPGGCSCSVPAAPSSGLAWLVGLALVGGLTARRRGRGQAQPTHRN